MEDNARLEEYWQKHLGYLAKLLAVWFAVSYGCGVLFVDTLDQVQFFGFKLGFWFSQQGSILTFVVLIIAYIFLMNNLDREYNVQED